LGAVMISSDLKKPVNTRLSKEEIWAKKFRPTILKEYCIFNLNSRFGAISKIELKFESDCFMEI
jgi:hypothetical protein